MGGKGRPSVILSTLKIKIKDTEKNLKNKGLICLKRARGAISRDHGGVSLGPLPSRCAPGCPTHSRQMGQRLLNPKEASLHVVLSWPSGEMERSRPGLSLSS